MKLANPMLGGPYEKYNCSLFLSVCVFVTQTPARSPASALGWSAYTKREQNMFDAIIMAATA